jgi:hypothetical protein
MRSMPMKKYSSPSPGSFFNSSKDIHRKCEKLVEKPVEKVQIPNKQKAPVKLLKK